MTERTEKRKCMKCNEIKSVNEFHWYSDGSRCLSWCKKCSNTYKRERYATNRDKMRARGRKYYSEHVEERRAHRKQYYATNKETERARNKEYKEKHREEMRAYRASRRRKAREFVSHYLDQRSCRKCGDIDKLLFHHITDEKNYAVARMVSVGRSIQKIKEEIKLCIVLCRPCHSKLHHAINRAIQ